MYPIPYLDESDSCGLSRCLWKECTWAPPTVSWEYGNRYPLYNFKDERCSFLTTLVYRSFKQIGILMGERTTLLNHLYWLNLKSDLSLIFHVNCCVSRWIQGSVLLFLFWKLCTILWRIQISIAAKNTKLKFSWVIHCWTITMPVPLLPISYFNVVPHLIVSGFGAGPTSRPRPIRVIGNRLETTKKGLSLFPFLLWACAFLLVGSTGQKSALASTKTVLHPWRFINYYITMLYI